jgi:hypothetical protein
MRGLNRLNPSSVSSARGFEPESLIVQLVGESGGGLQFVRGGNC